MSKIPVIRYRPRGIGENHAPIGDAFEIEMEQGSEAHKVLETAFRATHKAWIGDIKDEIMYLIPNYRVVMALRATGFGWENSAAVEALNILGRVIETATYIEIEEPPKRFVG